MGQPAFQLGVGLLGRNDRPFGQALGGAMQDLQRNQLAQQEAAMQRQRIEAAKQEQARLAQQQQWAQSQGYAAGMPQWAQKEAYKARQPMPPAESPSNVREWEYFSKLTPQQQQQYLTMKRANQWLDRGGEHMLPNPLDPTQPVATVDKTLPPAQRPDVKGQQAAATAAGTVTGRSQAEAAMGVSDAIAEAQNAVGIIDQMMSHPGLEYAVGKSSVLPIIPGTPPADFDALAKQLEGKAFLQAFETLKGGGQITQIEGEKATAAIARLSRAQTEEEYRRSLREFKNIIQRGIARAKAKGRQANGPTQGTGEFAGFSIIED